MILPSAIIFINADLRPPQLDKNKAPFLGEANNLAAQLQISEIISDQEFDARVVADPNYPVIIHLNNLRILVIRQSLQDYTNRELADIVLFVSHGLATVLKNNFGPPTLSVSLDRLNIFNLFFEIKNQNMCFFPLTCRKCKCGCCCNCFKHLPVPIQHLLINPFDISGVHDANCDNEFNNQDFINRK